MSSDKFRNKYRIPSARAQWWDYRNGASYFITICTAHKENYFGKIINGQMALSRIGIIADMLWHEIKNHVHRLGYDFAWQPRFYDRIIRNDDEYRRIACYIINNPANWKKDKVTI